MTFFDAKKQAELLSRTHQALYLAVDDGDRSSVVRLDDFVTGIYICDGRSNPSLDVWVMDKDNFSI